MSIWANIHRRSNGLQVRQEDTVQDDLDYFQEKSVMILKIRRWKVTIPNIGIKNNLKISRYECLEKDA